MRIDICITTRDRHLEVCNLIQSLRFQTFTEWDLYIVDGSETPIQYCDPFMKLIFLLRLEGHKVKVERATVLNENCKARMQCFSYGKNEFILRMDDDTFFSDNLDLQRLVEIAELGWDGVGGVTPTVGSPELKRSTKFVKPIINKIEFDTEGNIIVLGDDCGISYLENEVIPAHHLRSSFLFRRKMLEICPFDVPGQIAFREETKWSLRALWAGYKLCVVTNVKFLHLQTLSGGCRSSDYGMQVSLGDESFRLWAKRRYELLGDPIQIYDMEVLR